MSLDNWTVVKYLQIGRDCEVNAFAVRGDSVEQKRVVQGGVPGRFEPIHITIVQLVEILASEKTQWYYRDVVFIVNIKTFRLSSNTSDHYLTYFSEHNFWIGLKNYSNSNSPLNSLMQQESAPTWSVVVMVHHHRVILSVGSKFADLHPGQKVIFSINQCSARRSGQTRELLWLYWQRDWNRLWEHMSRRRSNSGGPV